MKTLTTIEKKLRELLSDVEPRKSKIEIGKLLAEARVNHFTNIEKGIPDYQGRSMAFRRWYGEILDDLNLPDQERSNLASAIRYATGNALRQMLTDEQLEEAGLKKISPKERGSKSYAKISAPYRIRHSQPDVSVNESPEELERWFTDIRNTLHLLPEDETKAFLRQVLEDLDSDRKKYGTN